MRCVKCGTEGIPGKKFCAECGTPLSNRCENCGSDNPPNAKFCADCGAQLGVPAQAATPKKSAEVQLQGTETPESENLDGERKTVTAVFADIKGSTELMEDLDPEEARAIIDPALKLMIDAVQRYDGYVVQSTGDGIFALFGAPIAHEDHPQRALYAALRMQEELKCYSDRIRQDGRLPLQARVGANTGEVVVRSIQTGAAQSEYTPIGHTANLASRMQALAPIGSIAVTETTRGLCEGYFVLKSLGPTRVKGLSEPVNVYEVTGLGPLRTRLQRAAGRGLTKFVGREHEMETLKRALEQTRAGRGQIVAAMAEPGVGKSRLFYEFKAVSQSGCMVLETFSVSHGKASAYLPIIDLLHGYFKIAGDDDVRTRREKVTGRVVALDRALEDALPYLLGLLGIADADDPLAQMDGQVKKQRTPEAIKRMLLRESLNQPLIVIFEDLHWIDEHTQEFLDRLANSIGTAKVLLLVNYRPEYSHQWGSKTYYTQLRLDPFGKDDALVMLAALIGDSAELGPLRRLIIEKTEGNPFFMEEMVLGLIDEKALVRNGAAMKLIKPLAELRIPPTVQAILAARIDRLPPDQKELLQTLSAIGREFGLNLIERVTHRRGEELNQMLAKLQLAEFIYEEPAVSELKYSFKHALTREVASNSMLLERRREIHERTAAAIEDLYPGMLDDHLGELAHHYSRSANAAKAVHYLKLAGEQAGRRSAYEEALGALEEAIGLLAKIPASRERDRLELELRVAHGPLYVAVRGFATAEMEPHVGRIQELCDQLGEAQVISGALYSLWSLNLARARLKEAMSQAKQLINLAAQLDDPFATGGAHGAVGVTSMWLGEFETAREHLEQTAAIFEPDLPRFLPMRNAPVIPTQSQLAWTLWMLGYADQANRTMRRALALADQLKRPFNTAFALQYAVPLEDFLGDYRFINQKIETLIEISREYGFMSWIDSANLSLGRALIFKGEHETGLSTILNALAGLREHGSELVRTFSLPSIAGCFLQTNQVDRGLEFIEEAFASMDTTGARIQEAETHRIKGDLLLRKGEAYIDEAKSCFERAIEIAAKQAAKSYELRATMSLARLCVQQGHRGEARKMLTEIYNWFTEGFDTADLKDAKALLNELG
jgi:class 3 adenylate cyclase/tetratricopeptide (TPR) repeat protein